MNTGYPQAKGVKVRIPLFLIGCLGSRTAIAYIVSSLSNKYRLLIASILLAPAIGFAVIYLFRLRRTGEEVFGDRIWWDKLRPFHSLMYFAAALAVYFQEKKAYLLIILDTLVGFVAFCHFHYANLAKL
jgi:hypothetical protein